MVRKEDMLGTQAGDGAHVIRDKSMPISSRQVRLKRASEAFASGVSEVTCR